LTIYVNDQYVATRWIPEIPGYWLEVPTLISSEYLNAADVPTRIRIVPDTTSGFYMPYSHEVYYYSYDKISDAPGEAVTTFQNGAIELSRTAIGYEPVTRQMVVAFDWYTDGSAQGDYKVFIHVLDEAGEIVAQADQRPGQGTLPPGNWLPGALHDTIMVDLSQLIPGNYPVAVGLYDPITFERLTPSSGGDAENRLFIGEVEIEDNG
jgi:hypothetical protein